MEQDPLVEKLVKANGDVKKLCEFFAARRGWYLAADADRSARDLVAAAKAIDEHLRAFIAKCGSEPSPPTEPAVTLAIAGALESARLLRFATFLRDLDSWFEAQTCPTDCPDGTTVLQEMEANLACMITLVEKIIVGQEQPTSHDISTQNDGAIEATTADGELSLTEVVVPDGVPQRLILDDTDEQPMVQEFQKIRELTPECQRLVDEFLAAWAIEYSYYNRKKLLERLLRWISSAPEGQVLVIKMKTAEEPFEPYPSYISRDVLAGKEPPQEL